MHRLARLGAALAFLVLLAPGATPAAAQAATGHVSGTVTMGTAGEPLRAGTIVTFIVLRSGEGVVESKTAEVAGGRYALDVDIDPALIYVPRVLYEGVQYFGDAVLLSPEEPSAVRDFEVFATTREAPSITITNTTVTVVAIDRGAAQLGLVRQDAVSIQGDRVFVGDDGGVTMRIPVPDGTTEAASGEGEPIPVEGGVISVTDPVLPHVDNLITTRYVVQYDAAADRYRLRITTPVASQRIEVRVPEGYAQRLEPLEPALTGASVSLDTEDGPVVLRAVELNGPIAPGRSLLADLRGLALDPRSNPLTEHPGAIVAALLSVAVLAGGLAGLRRLRPLP